MPSFPNRFIEITFSDGSRALDISGLKIEFDFEKALRSKPNSGTIHIWNLKPGSAKFIKDATAVQIVAGYDNNKGLVYKGDLRRVSNRRSGTTNKTRLAQTREGVDFITEVGLGGHLDLLTNAYFQRSYSGTVPLKTVLSDALPSFALVPSNLDILPDTTLEDYCWSGKTADMIDQLLLPTDFDWYEDDGLIVFHQTDVPITRGPVQINSDTGLLSTPEIEKRGIKFKTMLNPALRVGSPIEVTSVDNPEANGLWKISKLMLRGSNRDGEHTTTVEARRARG